MSFRFGMCIFLMAVLMGCASSRRADNPGQTAHQFEKDVVKRVSADYLLYLPKNYNQNNSKSWPLVLFLHGAGERGSDIEKVKIHGPPKLAANGEDFPFIMVSPQCPTGAWWPTDFLDPLLNEIQNSYRVDPDRVYITGLSMGGYGTWGLLQRFPNRFAAAVPICGGGDPVTANRFKHVPIWAFHGAQDKVVPLSKSQEMVDALKAAGSDVRFTIYPEANHDSWTETYNNPKVFEWLLSHRRK